MQTRRWSFCLLMGCCRVAETSGKTFHIPFSDDAASENEDTVDLRVLYFFDRYGVSDTFYHELAMLFSELPRYHAVKKARTYTSNKCCR